jgi:hypothetical protein
LVLKQKGIRTTQLTQIRGRWIEVKEVAQNNLVQFLLSFESHESNNHLNEALEATKT